MNQSLKFLSLFVLCVLAVGTVRAEIKKNARIVRWKSAYSQRKSCDKCDSCSGAGCDRCSGGCTDCASGGCDGGCDGYSASGDLLDGTVPPGQDDVMGGADLVSGSFGATAGSLGATPGMIGDFFGGTYMMLLQPPVTNGFGSPGFVNVPIAAADRRFKLSENNSPFPQDRFFFNYHHFKDPIRTVDGIPGSLDRYTVGLEKTFFDRRWSVEARIPFADGLRAEQISGAGADNFDSEVGNVSLVVKRLLYEGCCWRFSAGLGIVFPTGPEAEIYSSPGSLQLVIDNEAVYLQPFLGAMYTPTDRLFIQMFAQADFDTAGNEVDFITVGNSTGPDGVIQDQALLFLDVAMGYWLFREPCGCGLITGIAPMVELHYTTTMEDTDFIGVNGNIITNPSNRLDVLNLTAGLRFELRGRSYLTVAGVAPLRERDDEKIFDSEVQVQYVRTF